MVFSCLLQGDVILQCEHVFEAVTKLVMLVKKENLVNIVQGRWAIPASAGKAVLT